MTTDATPNQHGSSPGTWTELTVHDWDDETELLTTLVNVVDSLDSGNGRVRLHESVDLGAVIGAITPDHAGRQVSQIQFEHQGHEIRIADDGTIAVR